MQVVPILKGFDYKHLLQQSMECQIAGQPMGLYLHVPFCFSRCTYCSFVSCTDLSLETQYVKRLEQEIENWGTILSAPALDTMYLGGGTPSVLSIDSLRTITKAIHSAFDITGLLEATLEANPGTLTPDWLDAARSEGWNRISLGVQTLDTAVLESLGRTHDTPDVFAALELCKEAGFGRINADLLLGTPGQRLERVLDDAESLIEAGVEHLSIYLLDLDKPCSLKSQIDSGGIKLPEDGLVADAYQALQEYLPKLGFIQYEISNYSRAGRHSIHNMRYWHRLPYLGLGPGAASNIGNIRWSESENIEKWIRAEANQDVQILTPEESLAEIPLLGLRTHSGVDWKTLVRAAESRGLSKLISKWESALTPYITSGLLHQDDGIGRTLRLTAKGMLLSNLVFQVFVD